MKLVCIVEDIMIPSIFGEYNHNLKLNVKYTCNKFTWNSSCSKIIIKDISGTSLWCSRTYFRTLEDVRDGKILTILAD
jgi:hypothetical protein